MASPTREEIQRRIASDDGERGATVYVPTNNRSNSSVHCYHAHRRCETMRAETECAAHTRAHAQELGLAPCKVCILDDVAEPAGLAAKLEAMDPEDLGLSAMPSTEDDTPTRGNETES